MIAVDGPPEEWAGEVGELLADRGASSERLERFFAVVYAERGGTSR